VLVGGIAFDTPVDASTGAPSPEGANFTLYPSYESIEEAGYTVKVPYLLYFQGSVSGLKPGAPVTFHGMQLGVVESVHLEIDVKTATARIPVVIQLEPQRAVVVGDIADRTPQERMAQFVARGLRAQLASANLLTGALEIALDFFPDQPAATLVQQDGYTVIPTVPSEIEQLKQKATAFLNKLADAPVAELVTDLRTTVQEVDTLLQSKSLRQGVDGLREIGPALDSLKQTLNAARATLVQAETTLHSAGGAIGPDSALRYDLARMLNELTDTARSLRTLADYLERNPSSLIFGKSGGQ
jgi:paraquat-inducible protein B